MNTQVMFSSDNQTWETPIQLFNKLSLKFPFTLDVCALSETAKCSNYYTPEINGLEQNWGTNICWMNPLYNETGIWMKKAYEESRKGTIVVALIPSRTDTKYWHDYIMKANEVRFIKGILKFGNSKNSAPFPSAIIVYNIFSKYQCCHISTYDQGLLKPLVDISHEYPYNPLIEYKQI